MKRSYSTHSHTYYQTHNEWRFGDGRWRGVTCSICGFSALRDAVEQANLPIYSGPALPTSARNERAVAEVAP